jgi:prohibitin 2
MSNRSPFEEYINRARAVAQSGGRRGFPGGAPRGLGPAVAGLVLVGGGALLFQSALFNVDGGHRAIKYRRISGVSKDIYAEGAAPPISADADAEGFN